MGVTAGADRLLVGLAVAALVALGGAGCAGGSFHVDAPLAKTAMIPVSGARGFNAENCSGDGDLAPLAEDAAVSVGAFSAIVSASRRALSSRKMFGETALRDYERFLRQLGDGPSAERVADAQGQLSRSGDLGASIDALGHVGEALRGVHFVLSLPASTTETTTFTFLGKREGRTVAGACSTTDMAVTFGFFDRPNFTMSCRIVSSADGVPRALRVTSAGTWANARYEGELLTTNAERASLVTQNVSLAGAGGIRGFDLRSGDAQIAALSFWQVPSDASPNAKYLPRAWQAPMESIGWSDVVLATLALAYAYPWPSACDAARLRKKGMDAIDAQ